MVDEQTEVPWFSEPPAAELWWTEPGRLGHLKFIDPKGKLAIVHVTQDDSYDLTSGGSPFRTPVWHIELDGEVATVSPSVHFVGHWHSPNPVQFRIVDELPKAAA